MKSVVMHLFCEKLLRYKRIILSVDKRIKLLKLIRVAVTVFLDFPCGDVVFIYFFAVLQCSEPTCAPP